MDSQPFPNIFEDELFQKKLAYPYEVFNLSNFQEPLNLTKEDSWSTLKQTTPPDEEINRTKGLKKWYEERTRNNYVILKNGSFTISWLIRKLCWESYTWIQHQSFV